MWKDRSFISEIAPDVYFLRICSARQSFKWKIFVRGHRRKNPLSPLSTYLNLPLLIYHYCHIYE